MCPLFLLIVVAVKISGIVTSKAETAFVMINFLGFEGYLRVHKNHLQT